MYRTISMLILATLLSAPAHAIGEAFQLKARGVEYCEDATEARRFQPSDGATFWLRIDSLESVSLSRSKNFESDQTVAIPVTLHEDGASAFFIGGRMVSVEGEEEPALVSVEFKAKVDQKSGRFSDARFSGIKGSFVQKRMFDSTCDSSGTFRSRW